MADASAEVAATLRDRAKRSTYFMGKAVLGFADMTMRTHGPMCAFIDADPKRALALAPRSTFKSSLLTVADIIRRIVNNPEIRILLCSASQTNATHFLRMIQEVFERNQLFRALFPEVIPDFKTVKRWSQIEMVVPRQGMWPEATVEAIGVGGTVVSRHFDLIKNDDLIDEKGADSEIEIRQAIDWYKCQESLLVNPRTGFIHTVGTRWAFQDPYQWIIDNEPSLASYIRGAFDEHDDGEVYFPERLPRDELERLRLKMGSYRFSSLYLNKPVDPEAGSFQRSWLRWHTVEGDQVIPKGQTVGIPIDSMKLSMRVDPAISESRNAARTAIVVDGAAPDGRKYLLDVWAKRCQPFEMFDRIFTMAARWNVLEVAVEAVAYQRVIKPFLEAEAQRRGVYLRIIEVKPDTRKSKETRIRGVQPYLERGDISVSADHTMFLDEYDNFPMGTTVDVLDAWAYGPQVWEEPLEAIDGETEMEDAVTDAQRDGRSALTGY